MFESMLIKTVKPVDLTWEKPNLMFFKTEEAEEKTDRYDLLKGAEAFIHKQIDIKPGTSKELYKKAPEIWNQLRDVQLKKAEENPDQRFVFSLDKESVIYLVDDYKHVVDIFDARYDEVEKEFNEKLSEFLLDVTTHSKTKKFYCDGKGGLVKLICYDSKAILPEEDYTPIVIIEFNNQKAQYKVFTGILIYKTFTFIPAVSSYMDADRLSDFIKSIDISNALMTSKEHAEELYNAYKTFTENPVEISARELISLLKKVGYKLELKTDDQLDEISDMLDSESNMKIQNFFNTFTLITGETAYDILSLSELKKIFRYNKLTLLDVLSILSKEYLTAEGSKITCDVLSSIVFNLYDKQNDKRQMESLKKEIK